MINILDGLYRPPSAIVIGVAVDDRSVTYWPTQAEAFFGVAAHDALGSPANQLVAWHTRAHAVQTYQSLQVGDVWVFRHSVDDKLSNSHTFQTTVTRAESQTGRTEVLYTSVLTDEVEFGPGVDGRGVGQRDVGEIVEFDQLPMEAGLTNYCTGRMELSYTPATSQRAFGYVARDVLGHLSLEFVHPDDRQLWRQAWDAALTEPMVSQLVQVRWRHSDGRWLRAATELTNLLDNRSVASVVSRSRNLIEEHRPDSDYLLAEQTLHSVLRASGEGIWCVDAVGQTVFANARLAALLQLTQQQMSYCSLRRVLGDGLTGAVLSETAPRSMQFELAIGRLDGSTHQLRIGAVPRQGPDGSYIGSILMWSDLGATQEPLYPAFSERFGASVPLTAPITEAVSPPPSLRLSFPTLSSRETEIVARLAEGDRVATIAASLQIRQSSVRNHLQSVFRKLGIRSQQELIDMVRGRRPTSTD